MASKKSGRVTPRKVSPGHRKSNPTKPIVAQETSAKRKPDLSHLARRKSAPDLTQQEILNTPRSRGLAAKAAMRRKGWSLTRAAAEFKTTEQNVRNQSPGQFRKRGGRWRVKQADNDIRTMPILTPDGYVAVQIRGSKKASQLGRLNWAQANFARGRDPEGKFLREFQGKRFGQYTAITDLNDLDILANFDLIRTKDLGSDQIARGETR